MVTRREFLKVAGLAGLGLAIPWKFDLAKGFNLAKARAAVGPIPFPYSAAILATQYPDLPYPATQTNSPAAWAALRSNMYKDPLLASIPTYSPVGFYKWRPLYEVQFAQVDQKLSSVLPATPVWGYGQTRGKLTPHFPGYTFETRKGHPFYVRWVNNLPTNHLLHTAVDYAVAGAVAMGMGGYPLASGNSGGDLPMGAIIPESRGVVHLHGGAVRHEADGWPDFWLDPAGVDGPKSATYYYPNIQAATTLWYHDHGMATTRLNVHAGLAGYWIIRDFKEDMLSLPQNVGHKSPVEIPIVIQDRMFNEDGTLLFPETGSGGFIVQADNPQPWPSGRPTWSPEYFGDVAVVNGTVWPVLNVQPRRYRFRFLNGTNARFLNLWLQVGSDATIMDANGFLTPSGTSFVPFYQIGTDGGFLSKPLVLQGSMFMGPAFRNDVIVDFTNYKGQDIYLINTGVGPFPGGGGNVLTQIMKFAVNQPFDRRVPNPPIPRRLVPVKPLLESNAVKTRIITLNEWMAANGTSMGMQLGEDGGSFAALFGLDWAAPAQIQPKRGTTEVWQFVNRTGDAHPMHLHLVQFQVLDRFMIDANVFDSTGTLSEISGTRSGPQAFDVGWKDTAYVPSGGTGTYQVTRIIAKFGPYKGPYPYHCHIIDHEDNDMMRWFEVI
jgi:spore coat protein A, manganese oxidase